MSAIPKSVGVLTVAVTRAGQDRDHLDRSFQVGRERVAVLAVLNPPSVLTVNMLLRGVGESNATGFHRDRSCLRTSAASASLPAATSDSDWIKAACRAARSVSSSQSPGSNGRSSTSVPSGKVVGSSNTRRPARTRALIVMEMSVPSNQPPNKPLQPTSGAKALEG